MKKQIVLTTDGACVGNPGPGGWACILRYKDSYRELWGSEPATTNNRMELKAAIEGFGALKESCSVTVRTDSQYLRDGITKWIQDWKTNNWLHKVKHQGKQLIKNRDLWEEIDHIIEGHEVTWIWVKGHSTDPDNNRCDSLANDAAKGRLGSAQVRTRTSSV